MANNIQRITREEIGFAQIKNEVLYDSKLSLKAKGLYAYIYSKPDTYDFSAKRIANETNDGVDGIHSAFNELEKHGYLVKNKRGDGKMIYKLFLTPITQNGKNPEWENPCLGKSLLGKIPSISNTDSLSNTKIKSNTDFAKDKPLPKFSPLGADIIKEFEIIDPKNKSYYANTTQRKACDFLIENYGLEYVLRVIGSLKLTNGMEYFPVITTPLQLKEKWTTLEARAQKWKSEKKVKDGKFKIAFT